MKTATLMVALIVVLVCGCSQAPAPVYDYEGTWIDETIPLTLVIDAGQFGVYGYELSSGGDVYLSGVFEGQPNGAIVFTYDDGVLRQMEFIGVIDGDTLIGTFHHTGLVPDDYIVKMARS